MRLPLLLFSVFFFAACTFSPKLLDSEYPPCGPDGQCPDDCVCLGDQVCVPFEQGVDCVDEPCQCDDDGNPCTDEACDAEGNCLHTPNNRACDDGDHCTTEDTCSEGRCGGLLMVCEGALLVGPQPNACPHLDLDGSSVSLCDFSGAGGLGEALGLASAWDRIMLFDDDGAPFEYQGCVDVPGGVDLGAAPGVAREGVVIFCSPERRSNGVLRLIGDEVRLHDMTLVAGYKSETAVCAWPAYDNPEGATSGHLLENLSAFSAAPEWLQNNSTTAPLRMGPNTTVRSCHFWGYFEGSLDLGPATGSRLLFNTFVMFGDPHHPVNATEAVNVVLANNVIINLTPAHDTWIDASAETCGLVVTGNLVEGFEKTVDSLDPMADDNRVEDNTLGPVEAESPLVPRLLADSTQVASDAFAGEGISLDGVLLEGRTDLVPGAFQIRSAERRPRRTFTRVGDGDCSGRPCHVHQAAPNEIQQAVWSTWPGGTVEIYPAFMPYAGNAVISWSVDVVGLGSQPGDTVLVNTPEDLVPWSWGLWTNHHNSLLAVVVSAGRPMRIANLTLRLLADGQPSDRALLFEGLQEDWDRLTDWVPTDRHRIERVVIETEGTGVEHFQAMQLGSRVRVQNSLIRGEFSACLTFGTRFSADQPTPRSRGEVVNLTCRLTGTLDHAPMAAFEVASADGLLFANVNVQLATAAPLFLAQRRASGDESPLALDAPLNLRALAISAQGIERLTSGFALDPPAVELEMNALAEDEPFFVSDHDSHLADNAAAMDSGVDPATLGIEGLTPGLSLDGIDRNDRKIDRGAHEQGQ